VLHKPRLLSDNGPSYIAGELAEYIEANQMSHLRGAPMHPQTQGKIERCEPPRDCRRPFVFSYAAMGASSSMA
jgi:transposase InsO family protein